MPAVDTVVVGCGITGLTIARGLQQRGQRVVVIDKGRRPGGRFSSRLFHGALVDTGPLRLPSASLECLRDADRRVGLATSAFSIVDGATRWSRPAGDIAAEWADGLEIRRGIATHVTVTAPGEGAVVWFGDGEELACSTVVLTPPAPQALQLLSASNLPIPSGLEVAAYDQRLVLIAWVEDLGATERPCASEIATIGSTGIVEDGAVITLVATASWSASAWCLDVQVALGDLLLELERMCPGVRLRDAELKRWRYANPVTSVGVPHASVVSSPNILIAGDTFGAEDERLPGVDRAVRSALSVLSAIS